MQGLLASEFAPFAIVNTDSLTIHLTRSNKVMKPACRGVRPQQYEYVWSYRLEDPTYFKGRDLSKVHLCEKCKALRDAGLNLEME